MRIIVLLVVISTYIFSQPMQAQDLKTMLKSYKVVFNESISDRSTERFTFSDTAQWILTKNGNPGRDLKCTGGNTELSKMSHPTQYGIIKGIEAGDFVLEFDFLEKGRDFSVRDICVLYAFSDSLNYNFVQASSEETKLTHNVFTFQDGYWRKIGKSLNKGTIWSYDKWHDIKVIRHIAAHTLQLLIDDVLVIETSADTDKIGKVGFGTFGSEFKIDNLKLWVPVTK